MTCLNHQLIANEMVSSYDELTTTRSSDYYSMKLIHQILYFLSCSLKFIGGDPYFLCRWMDVNVVLMSTSLWIIHASSCHKARALALCRQLNLLRYSTSSRQQRIGFTKIPYYQSLLAWSRANRDDSHVSRGRLTVWLASVCICKITNIVVK